MEISANVKQRQTSSNLINHWNLMTKGHEMDTHIIKKSSIDILERNWAAANPLKQPESTSQEKI